MTPFNPGEGELLETKAYESKKKLQPKIQKHSTADPTRGSIGSDHFLTTCSAGSWTAGVDISHSVIDFPNPPDLFLTATAAHAGPPVPKSVEDIINRLPPKLDSDIPVLRRKKTVFEDFDVLKEIGSGTYAKVYKLRHRLTHAISAGKFLKPYKFPRNTERRVVQMFTNEITLLARTQCPGTVKMNAVYWSADGVLIDLEYVDGGTIWRERVCPTVESRWSHLVEILQGVQFLHDRGVVHRDLKPTNILRNHESHLKIADFGWAEEVQKLRTTPGEWPGTLEINPPEVLNYTGPLTERIDNYAIGMNFLLFISNRFVCRQKGLSVAIAVPVILKMVENLRKSHKTPPNFTAETWAIFLGLTDPDPNRRWTINQLYHHPWLVRHFIHFAETKPRGALDELLWLESARAAFDGHRIPSDLPNIGVGSGPNSCAASPVSKSKSLFHRVFQAPRTIFDWTPSITDSAKDDRHSSPNFRANRSRRIPVNEGDHPLSWTEDRPTRLQEESGRWDKCIPL